MSLGNLVFNFKKPAGSPKKTLSGEVDVLDRFNQSACKHNRQSKQ